MRLYLPIVAAVPLLFACNPENNPSEEKKDTKELIVTAEASEIDYTSATLSGYANLSEGMTGVSFGIIISQEENLTVDNGIIIRANELDKNNKFHCKISNLSIGTKYYYKAYLKEGDYYRTGSKTLSFTTKDFADDLIITAEATEINCLSAILNGSANIPSGLTGGTFGFIFSEKEDPTVDNGKVIQCKELDGSNRFSYKATNLSMVKTYYYKAYFKYNGEYRLGKTRSFTTKDYADDLIVTTEASEIDYYSAVLNGSANIPSELTGGSFGFILSGNADPTVNNGRVIQCKELDENNKFSYKATSLSMGRTYYYKAYFKFNGEYRTGKTRSFTTKVFADNVIITAEVSEIDLVSAVLNGYVNIPSGLIGGTFGFVLSDNTDPDGKIIQCKELDGNNKFSYKATSLSMGKTYYVRAYFEYDGEYLTGMVRSFTTKDYADRAQAVDLGLSVKWASFNLGATKPEEYGLYYAWGEIESKDEHSFGTYSMTKYSFTDGKKVLDPEDDVAYYRSGGIWRMPTDAEWTELRSKCTWSWTTMNGIYGRRVTGPNGSSIFLPAAGYCDAMGLQDIGVRGAYWSSSLYTNSPDAAWSVSFSSSKVSRNCIYRNYGLSIRPVCD